MRMKNNIAYRVLLIASVIVVLNACSKSVERPATVLPEEKMQAVMLDLYLLDGAANAKLMPIGDTTKVVYYNAILKKHNITLAQFDSSMVWYAKHLQVFEKMHKPVLDSLEARNKLVNPSPDKK